MQKELLRLPKVLNMTGASRSSVYNWMRQGRFPEPVKLGGRAVAWRRESIEKWMEELPTASISKTPEGNK